MGTGGGLQNRRRDLGRLLDESEVWAIGMKAANQGGDHERAETRKSLISHIAIDSLKRIGIVCVCVLSFQS